MNLLNKIRKIIIYKILKLKTRGVRVIFIKDNKILLIKHRYDDFWVFPGGGIKKSENPLEAAKRESQEEVGLSFTGPANKLGVYKNFSGGKKDYVHVYVVKKFSKHNGSKSFLGKLEVKYKQWFPLDKLPKTSAATKRRIAEVSDNDFSLKTRDW